MPDPSPSSKRPFPSWANYLLLIAAVLLLSLLFTREQQVVPSYDIAYSRFLALVRDGDVAQITLHDKRIDGALKSNMPIGPQNAQAIRFSSRVPDMGDWNSTASRSRRPEPIRRASCKPFCSACCPGCS